MKNYIRNKFLNPNYQKTNTVNRLVIFTLLSVALVSCSPNEDDDIQSCGTLISTYTDTLEINSQKIYFNFFCSENSNPTQTAGIELISIPSSSLPGVTVDLLQCKKGSLCLESTTLVSMVPNTGQMYVIENAPVWLADNSTEAFIRIHLNGISYFLHDPHSNQ